jgi:hypothetical protein
MQISRHWRMNAQRYRLEGVQYGNGEVAVQARRIVVPEGQLHHSEKSAQKEEKHAAVSAA